MALKLVTFDDKKNLNNNPEIARINYADNSNEIIPISFTQVGSVMRTEFTIYNSKDIINIELISEDEKTTYNTITVDFELNKTYTVSQDVTVEGLVIGG